jgi:C-terminal processing protease CtpA/Prc
LDIKHDGLEWTQRRIPTNIGKRQDGASGGISVYSQEEFKYEFSLRPIYKVGNVREGSPADLAGVQVDDEILKINGSSAQNMKLKQIIGKFLHKEGDIIRLVLKRGVEEVKAEFKLIDPIPYKKEINNKKG